MKIQILGSGCTTCKKLFELTKKAIQDLGKDYPVEYITDMSKILEMGVLSSPVLAIDGKPVMVGATASIERVKDLIIKGEKRISNRREEVCSCEEGCC